MGEVINFPKASGSSSALRMGYWRPMDSDDLASAYPEALKFLMTHSCYGKFVERINPKMASTLFNGFPRSASGAKAASPPEAKRLAIASPAELRSREKGKPERGEAEIIPISLTRSPHITIEI